MKTTRNNFKQIILCLALLFSFNMYSQKKSNKVKVYKTWVKLTDGTKQKGFLYSVDDKSLNIVSNSSLKNLSDVEIIRANDIHEIYIRRKGKVWKSTLIGTLGTAIAIELVLISVNSDGEGSYIPNEAAAASLGVLLGAPIGAIIGTKRKKFVINSNGAIFKTKYEELIRYALIKNPE